MENYFFLARAAHNCWQTDTSTNWKKSTLKSFKLDFCCFLQCCHWNKNNLIKKSTKISNIVPQGGNILSVAIFLIASNFNMFDIKHVCQTHEVGSKWFYVVNEKNYSIKNLIKKELTIKNKFWNIFFKNYFFKKRKNSTKFARKRTKWQRCFLLFANVVNPEIFLSIQWFSLQIQRFSK